MYSFGNPHTGVVPKAFMTDFMNKVRLNDKDFNTENFQLGSSGESSLLNVLRNTP